MKRLWYACIVALVVVTAGAFSGRTAVAQADYLPAEDLILRIEEDTDWIFIDREGVESAEEYAQMIDGVSQGELHPTTDAYYKEHNVQSVHIFMADIRPAQNTYDTIATEVELRVMTFENVNDATAYQTNFFDSLYQEDVADNEGRNQHQLMDQLPPSSYPTVGFTSLQSYFRSNGDPLGDASSVRFMAQHDTVLVSAQVQGPFVDFNFDLAYGLLHYQIDCVVNNVACDPVSISEVTPAWGFTMRKLFFDDGSGTVTMARFEFPVQEPVRAPEMGVMLETSSSGENATGEETSGAGTTERTIRTTSRSESSAPTRVTRTTRTSSSSESSGTTPVRRVTRESTTSTDSESANATVIAVSADVFTEPDASSDVMVTLEQDARVTVTGDPEMFDGALWVPVVTEFGEQGWMSPADLWKD